MMPERIHKLLGAKIRDIRKAKGLSQEQLGELAGFHYSYIGGIERGEKNISLSNIQKVADALDIDISELFSYSRIVNKALLSEKESDIQDILILLLKQDPKDIRKAKVILNELFPRK
jgi:transcriptional regulator with XRE-family HTH domain